MFQEGKQIRLYGFQSTSKYIDVAKNFATDSLPTDKVAVLYEIEFSSQHGIIDLQKFSAYDDEEEILLQDGLEYKVTQIQYIRQNRKTKKGLSLISSTLSTAK